jgi:hypothetical protein
LPRVSDPRKFVDVPPIRRRLIPALHGHGLRSHAGARACGWFFQGTAKPARGALNIVVNQKAADGLKSICLLRALNGNALS